MSDRNTADMRGAWRDAAKLGFEAGSGGQPMMQVEPWPYEALEPQPVPTPPWRIDLFSAAIGGLITLGLFLLPIFIALCWRTPS